MFVHEQSYKGNRLSSMIHRARLSKILEVLRSLSLPAAGTIADFGCSNGFFFSALLQSMPEVRSMHLFGFDHSRELIASAKSKNLKNATFEYFDFNSAPIGPLRTFDVVTCFETLEHIGNIRNALDTLLVHCKDGGKIVLSVPNESGIPGLLKFLGRKVGRRKPYGYFFVNQSQLRYLWHLITGKSTAIFRNASADGYGPHLGFDWRIVENYLSTTETCELVMKHNLFFGFIFVVRKS